MTNKNLFVILLLFSTHGYSQQYSVLKINAGGAVTNRLGIAIEHSFLKRMSAQLMFESGQYALRDDTQIGGDKYKVSGYSMIPEIRFYPFRGVQKSPEGLFAGVSFRYLKFTEQDMRYFSTGFTYISTGTLTNLGLDVGYKFSAQKFWIEFLIGYGLKGAVSYDYLDNAKTIPYNYSNNVFLNDANKFIRTELSLGYIF